LHLFNVREESLAGELLLYLFEERFTAGGACWNVTDGTPTRYAECALRLAMHYLDDSLAVLTAYCIIFLLLTILFLDARQGRSVVD